jgi:hypothetical protein
MAVNTHVTRLLSNKIFQLSIILAITIGITTLSYKQTSATKSGQKHSGYNNYLIFKNSSAHLLHNQNLYAPYPEEQFDLYKYSPTFALFMLPFGLLPDAPGLFLWNIINLLMLYIALIRLTGMTDFRKALLFWFVLCEMAGNMIYDQSNTLITGIIVFAFLFMEKDRPVWASLFIVITIYIKIYGIVAGILFLLYPKRIKYIAYSMGWFILLALLPGLLTGFKSLLQQYSWWIDLLQMDHGKEINFSLMGLLKYYLNIEAFSVWSLVCGAVILLIPFLRTSHYNEYGFRILITSTLLMWLLIFNHMAEPSSFIIEMTGIGLWFFPFRRGVYDLVLLFIALTFISLVGLDIFPHSWRDEFFGPYKIKAMPGILIWIKATLELYFPSLRPELLLKKLN